jgi:hypothetical protein
VGAYAYDLSPLASKIGAVDLQATDNTNQVYYYRVCGVVSSSFCQTVTDNTPAVCQKDSRIPSEYHDSGSQKTATFGLLPGASEQDGFALSFTGGEQDRASVILYVWYVGVKLTTTTTTSWWPSATLCSRGEATASLLNHAMMMMMS